MNRALAKIGSAINVKSMKAYRQDKLILRLDLLLRNQRLIIRYYEK